MIRTFVYYYGGGDISCKRVPLNTQGSAEHESTYPGQDAKPFTTNIPPTVVRIFRSLNENWA